MTEMAQKTEKQAKFDLWLEELRSGNYIQATGYLHLRDGDVHSYCCVGILDEKIYGTKWDEASALEIGDYGEICYADDAGESTLMSEDRVVDMDLDITITNSERGYLEDIGVPIEGEVTRIAALSTINDAGHTFESIADYIEELGWNL